MCLYHQLLRAYRSGHQHGAVDLARLKRRRRLPGGEARRKALDPGETGRQRQTARRQKRHQPRRCSGVGASPPCSHS
uniref:Uncharacterized protein n=1 Tax=Arundo donax TaxID=35708 RepID=A0A0A8XT21_ARUDO